MAYKTKRILDKINGINKQSWQKEVKNDFGDTSKTPKELY